MALALTLLGAAAATAALAVYTFFGAYWRAWRRGNRK